MNVEDLTLKQIREIQALTATVAPAPPACPNGVERAVVVCTDKRGVFFGYTTDTHGDRIFLRRARMAVFWSSTIKGVLGLAATGPDDKCRISSAPPAIEVRGITCVMECSEQAVKAWEASPWIKS